MLYGFLWSGKREKIKRNTLIGNKMQGGIEMIDLESFIITIKLKWITALTSIDDANWKLIPKYYFRNYGNNLLIFYSNLDSMKSIRTNHLPEFYKNLLEVWLKCRSPDNKQISTYSDVRKQIIWGNKFIKINGQCLIFNSWINSNLIFINDIINERG